MVKSIFKREYNFLKMEILQIEDGAMYLNLQQRGSKKDRITIWLTNDYPSFVIEAFEDLLDKIKQIELDKKSKIKVRVQYFLPEYDELTGMSGWIKKHKTDFYVFEDVPAAEEFMNECQSNKYIYKVLMED